MSEKHDFLHRLTPFKNFSDREIVELARICDQYAFEKGAIFAYQGDVADRTYLVNQGKLTAYKTDPRGVVLETEIFKQGDVVHGEWLLNPGVHEATLRAATEGTVYIIDTVDMQDFLDRFPSAPIFEEQTETDEEGERDPQQRREKTTDTRYQRYGVASGEVIEYQSRRTLILLAFEMILPLLGTIVMWLLIFAGGRLFEAGLSVWLAVVVVLLTLPFLGLAIYRFLDWSNDYLLMTNRHLVHQEYDLRRFAGETLTLPLDQVQSVRVDKPNFIETFLNIGTIEVTTSAQNQKLIFNKINNPAEFEQVFNKIRQREKKVSTSRTRAEVRAFLREEFAVPDALSPVTQEGESQADMEERVEGRKTRRRLRRRFGTTRTRLDDNTIIYGKHWIVIAQQVWWIVLLMLFTIGLTFVTWSMLFTIPFTFVVGGFIFLLEAAFFYYVYEDWANDVFMLTGDLVVDVDRGPFGFTENRKAAQLGNVQDVRAVRPNILAAIFRYGNVVIDTAGASAEIVFENVANPTLVQSDIFERRQHVLRKKAAAEATSRRRELGLILREFQQLQANEDLPDYALPDPDEEEIENF